ncbi:MAG: hypothetical protein OEV64_11825, partial [Desulfobulbaceae bacterium]|nr:hypothetical protein [Desulfobulbaceae bacterium]
MKNLSAHPFKILLFLGWFLLLGLLINRDFFVPTLSTRESQLLQNAREETYYGVWFQRKRIGYVVEQLQPIEDGKYLLRQKANLNLKVLKTVQPVNMDLEAELDGDFTLRTFHFTFSSSFYTMKADGRIEGNTVHFNMDTGQSLIKDSVTLPKKPMAPLNQRSYLLENLPEKGHKIKVTSFDPLSLSGKESTIEYMGREKSLIRA